MANLYYDSIGYTEKCQQVAVNFLPQHQPTQPGIESIMDPPPIFENSEYKGTGKLKDKVAIITGGDSGIGRAVAVAFAKEGADLCIVYYDEHDDANFTKKLVEAQGRKCILISGDVKQSEFCKFSVEETIAKLGKLDVLVNNAGVQFPQTNLEDISDEQFATTFHTNIFAMFYMAKHARPYLKDGSCIINTTSVTAYIGQQNLMDYSSTKGAIVSFTRALARSLADKHIRVNAVAPGPIWTPLIPASFDDQEIETFGSSVPMKRPAQPVELVPTYIYLASDDSSYVTGQVLHVDGGNTMQS